MLLGTDHSFYSAINHSKREVAESIFAYSDIRYSLISKSINNCEQNSIISTINSFSSSGLRMQALSILEECLLKNFR